MRVLVTGSRYLRNDQLIDRVLSDLRPTVIIHGGAEGADMLADAWAKARNIPVEVYPAEWTRFGKKAGMLRNRQMFKASKPDHVAAFPLPSSVGTWGMIRLVQEAQKSGWQGGCTIHAEGDLGEI